MPTLSMVRSAALDTRRRTQRFSLSTQKRRDCKLGKKRRLVLLLACDTLLPDIGRLPVTLQTRAMVSLQTSKIVKRDLYHKKQCCFKQFSEKTAFLGFKPPKCCFCETVCRLRQRGSRLKNAPDAGCAAAFQTAGISRAGRRIRAGCVRPRGWRTRLSAACGTRSYCRASAWAWAGQRWRD